MRNRRSVALATVIALVCFMAIPATDAAAKGKGKYWCEKESKYSKGLGEKLFKKCHFILMKKDELDLSDDQVEKVVTIKVQAKKDYIMKKASIEAAAVDIKAELWKDDIDVNAINRLIDTKYSAKNEKAKMLVKAYADLKDTLSPSQMEELKKLWKECEEEKECQRCDMGHKKGMMGHYWGQSPFFSGGKKS